MVNESWVLFITNEVSSERIFKRTFRTSAVLISLNLLFSPHRLTYSHIIPNFILKPYLSFFHFFEKITFHEFYCLFFCVPGIPRLELRLLPEHRPSPWLVSEGRSDHPHQAQKCRRQARGGTWSGRSFFLWALATSSGPLPGRRL